MTDDEIVRLRWVNDQLRHCEAEVGRLRYWRMQLVRSLLNDGASEWHIAEMLGITPNDVLEWAWRADPRSTHNLTRHVRESPGRTDETGRKTPGNEHRTRSYKADVGGSSPSAPTDDIRRSDSMDGSSDHPLT